MEQQALEDIFRAKNIELRQAAEAEMIAVYLSAEAEGASAFTEMAYYAARFMSEVGLYLTRLSQGQNPTTLSPPTLPRGGITKIQANVATGDKLLSKLHALKVAYTASDAEGMKNVTWDS